MQVPEEARQSLNPLSPFQVLAELFCCSPAWSSPSEISGCQSPSFHFFASLWYLCISPAPLPLHFSYICRGSFLVWGSRTLPFTPSVTQLLQQAAGSGGLRAADGQPATLTPATRPPKSCRASPVPWASMSRCLMAAARQRPDSHWGTREQNNPKCSSWGTGCPCWALASVGCWLCSVTFWIRYILQLKVLGLFR